MKRFRRRSGEGGQSLRVAMIPLLPGHNAATRTFCEEPLKYLASRGVTGRVFSPSSDRTYRLLNRSHRRSRVVLAALYWYGLVLPRRLVQIIAATRYDVIFIQRGMLRYVSPPVLEALVWLLVGRLAGRTILYHCDDALYAVANPAYYRARFRMADWVITGSDEVAAFARSVNPRVWQFSAPVDVRRYPMKAHRGGACTIGWIGTVPENGLPLVTGALATVCEQRDVLVKVVSAQPFRPYQLGEKVVWEQWSPTRRFSVFEDFDIGIMPLTDDPYSRGKEGFKLKEYMAAGLPVVCSPVGYNRQIVQHGVNGFLADTEMEWVRYLIRLADSPELRAELGKAGRHAAEALFDYPKELGRFGEFLLAVQASHSMLPVVRTSVHVSDGNAGGRAAGQLMSRIGGTSARRRIRS
jgi:glycosyltransferase involved in cell wall biosynthesis